MNKKLMNAMCNCDEALDIKRFAVMEYIEECLNLNEVVYDGSVISIYELNKILKEKMDYISELCSLENYIIKKSEIFAIFSNEKSLIMPTFDEENREVINFSLLNHKDNTGIDFNIFLENDKITSKLFRYNVHNYSLVLKEDDRQLFNDYPTSDEIKIKTFLNEFIIDNKEIILDLLEVLKNINELGKDLIVEQDFFENKFNLKISSVFDAYLKDFNLTIDFLDSKNNIYNLNKLGLSEYFSSKKEELLKRISIPINELNHFYKNEIDNYCNSINFVDYKSYKRKK